MEKNKKRPSVWQTRIEVLRFFYKKNYEIAAAHHLNMIEFKGCSKKEFVIYLSHNHRLSDEAVSEMAKNNMSLALSLWLKYNQFGVNEECMDVLVKKLGYETLLKYGFLLSEAHTFEFVKQKNFELISRYIDQLNFSAASEAIFLTYADAKTAALYIEKNVLFSDNYPLILLYDEAAVYKAFGSRYSFEGNILSEIIKKKPFHIFELVLSFVHFISFEQEKILIDRGDALFLEAFLKKQELSSKAQIYLSENANDEMFSAFLRGGHLVFEAMDAICFRLFQPGYENLLISFLAHYRLPENYEIKLLEEGSEHLQNIYFDADDPLCPATYDWLIEHISSERSKKLLLGNAGYATELKLFQTGDAELIKRHLAHRNLNAFSEGGLFLHAPREILLSYMKEKVLGRWAQIALVKRKDKELLNFFINKGSFFDEEAVKVFLSTADVEICLSYLEKLTKIAPIIFYDCREQDTERCGEIIFKRQNKELSLFFVNHAILSCEDQIALVKYADRDIIRSYFLSDQKFFEQAERELIRKGDMELIEAYIETHALYRDNEEMLFMLFDSDLITHYHNLYGFCDNYVLNTLDL